MTSQIMSYQHLSKNKKNTRGSSPCGNFPQGSLMKGDYLWRSSTKGEEWWGVGSLGGIWGGRVFRTPFSIYEGMLFCSFMFKTGVLKIILCFQINLIHQNQVYLKLTTLLPEIIEQATVTLVSRQPLWLDVVIQYHHSVSSLNNLTSAYLSLLVHFLKSSESRVFITCTFFRTISCLVRKIASNFRETFLTVLRICFLSCEGFVTVTDIFHWYHL